MINKIYFDTCAFYGLLIKSDSLHQLCTDIFKELIEKYKVSFLTSTWVKYEALSKLKKHGISYCEKLEKIIYNQKIIVEFVSNDIEERALNLFWSYKDKKWSIIDCISIVIMQEKSIYYAFSSDHHFSEASLFPLIEYNKQTRIPQKSFSIIHFPI